MNDNYDEIEEELKEENKIKEKLHKVSGHSVFDLQRMIKDKASQDEKKDKGTQKSE